MNPRRFEFEVGAAPVKRPAPAQVRETVQAAPQPGADAKREDTQVDQTIEEPGYGHGV
jgi:hypothetical protein